VNENELDRLFAQYTDRRGFIKLAGMTTFGAALLAACKKAEDGGGGGGATSTTGGIVRPPIEEEPGGLQVFDWTGYGDQFYYPEEKEFLWGQYLKNTGDTPEFVVFENDDAGYTKTAAGATYDVVHPCGYKYKDWVDLEVMQPWDTSLIPNFPNLNAKLMESGVVDGQQYFIPLDWGFIAPLDSMSWVDTLNMFHVAGLFLGIPDVYNMTDDELVEVRDFLISKKPLVRFLWSQSFDFWLAFKAEEVWAGYAWPDTVGYADKRGMNYKYLKPKEGRISWVCGMGLFADTDNYFHAHEYVDSWASTKAAEFLLAYYYYGHTNTQVDLSVVSPGIIEALGLDDPTVLEPPNAIPESYMPRRELYAQYWAEVLAS